MVVVRHRWSSTMGCAGMASSLVFFSIFMIIGRRLKDTPFVEREDWPLVSIVVAACNEAETIEPALRTLLTQDYPNLEIVVVNDRSTDRTGQIVEGLAADDPRVKVVHIETLPENWLGKVHALHRGAALSKGDWIIFTDADVRFAPNLVKKCVAIAEDEKHDHLTLLPAMISESLLTNWLIYSSLRGALFGAQFWQYKNPDKERGIGAGAFNMVRRSVFEKTPGFEWLRMEVADDLGLGLMMKKAGASTVFFVASEEIFVSWYNTVKSAFHGLEKNTFGNAAKCSFLRGMVFAVGILIASLSPFLAFVPMPWPWMWMVGVGAFSIAFVANAIFSRWAGIPMLPLWLSQPFGDILVSCLFIWSSWRGWRHGGLIWRDTVYPSSKIREGMRVKLF
jgi:cellulose synthase/poly-beta-1,6-N-acetylglucosamine synthase-like glycosyltransferase